MKKAMCVILFVLSLGFCGCSNNNKIMQDENNQLKGKVAQLEQELQKKGTNNLTINYIDYTFNKRFIEKECDLYGLPQNNPIKLNSIKKNTVITVLDAANVDNIIWLYVIIPVYDSPSNFKGWIRESDTVEYSKEKIHDVQSDVEIKEGNLVYETLDFNTIKSSTPTKITNDTKGRIEERKEGFVRITCAGGKSVWVNESFIIYPEVK